MALPEGFDAASSFADIVKRIQQVSAEPPKIKEFRITSAPIDGKVLMIGRHAYITEGDLQKMVAGKSETAITSAIVGIPILREYPPEEFCANCGYNEFILRNYDPQWRDGDLCCKQCGTKLRDWDAG